MKQKHTSKPILFVLATLAGLAGVFVLRSSAVSILPKHIPHTHQQASPKKSAAPKTSFLKQPATGDSTQASTDSKANTAASPTDPTDIPPKTAPTTVAITDPTVKAQPPTFSSDILKSKDYPEKSYYMQTSPNDPLMPQWFSTMIEADQAWTITGNRAVTIAVIDTGFALNHEEFTNRWAVNSGEQGTTTSGGICWTGTPANKQTNNCDDDNNGYIDDWRGWDFNDNSNNPQTGKVNPTGNGVAHGTNTAGLAAATGNNAKGIAGLNWTARIMPLQALSDNGSGYTSDIVAAIEYAVDNGADVINMSLGGPSYDEAMDNAIAYAESRGVSVVAASGNCATSTSGGCADALAPGYMLYPALYPNVIAVGAVSLTDQRAYFSSYGTLLDVVAPGSNVTSAPSWTAANPTNAYASNISGTSFASPIVAGIVSLMKVNAPNLLPSQIRNIITESTDKVVGMGGQNWTSEYGFGRVNAFKAVAQAKAAPSILLLAAASPAGQYATPVVHAAFGQPGSRLAKTTDAIPVYCYTRPGNACTVTITNKANGAQTSLVTAKADASGSVYVLAAPLAASEYAVTAHDGKAASNSETIVVQ